MGKKIKKSIELKSIYLPVSFMILSDCLNDVYMIISYRYCEVNDHMKEEKRNLYYMDIIRAVCCFSVFTEHFTACFSMNLLKLLRAYTCYTPFLYLNDARMGINMFCTMGGFLIFYHSYDNELNINRKRVRNTLIKRFVFMFLACALICLLTFLLIRAGLMYSHRAFSLGAESYLDNLCSKEPTLTNLLICLRGIITGTNTLFAPHFWTMRYDILIGSVSLLLLFVSGNNKRLRWGLYAAALILFFFFSGSFSQAFIFGMISAELSKATSGREYKKGLLAAGMIASAAASVLAYTFGMHILVPVFDAVFLFLGYHAFGNKKITAPILKYINRFGTVTFSFYLCHLMVILTFSSAMYCLFINVLPRRVLFLINYPVSFALTLGITALYQKFFLNPLSGLIRKLLSRPGSR